MVKRKSLLILSRAQFGYDLYYFYCKLAAKQFRITYVGFDTGRPKLSLEGVRVKYVSYKGGRGRRYARLVVTFARTVRQWRGAVLIKYFPGCGILRCFGPGTGMIVDIRTGSISRNRLVRRFQDQLMRWESGLFHNVSAVSQSLAERLKLPPAKTYILPLGAERVATTGKRFGRLDLLYVGTLHRRCIEDTVVGLERFLHDTKGSIPLTYTIVGDGYNGELERLRRLVRSRGLDRFVHVPGFVHTTQLDDVFRRCSVGVSYVPINDIYDCQPVTKTFEYIFAGMAVIATATRENKKVVNDRNGVLIQDTPEDFCRGLKEVCQRRRQYDPKEIQRSCPEFSWDHIVGHKLVPYLQEL